MPKDIPANGLSTALAAASRVIPRYERRPGPRRSVYPIALLRGSVNCQYPVTAQDAGLDGVPSVRINTTPSGEPLIRSRTLDSGDLCVGQCEAEEPPPSRKGDKFSSGTWLSPAVDEVTPAASDIRPTIQELGQPLPSAAAHRELTVASGGNISSGRVVVGDRRGKAVLG